LKKAGVEAKLIVKQKAGHGWLTIGQDVPQFADWFDSHLKAGDSASQPEPAKAAPLPR
jgi:hypothetical protein